MFAQLKSSRVYLKFVANATNERDDNATALRRKQTPVRKTPVSDHFSSEKSSEESAPLRSVENSQNYQI